MAEHNIPEEIVSAWKDAVSSKSKGAKNALFHAFLAAGKSWSQLRGCNFLLNFSEPCPILKVEDPAHPHPH